MQMSIHTLLVRVSGCNPEADVACQGGCGGLRGTAESTDVYSSCTPEPTASSAHSVHAMARACQWVDSVGNAIST